MTSPTQPLAIDPKTARIAERNLDLFRGFHEALLDDPERFHEIPKDAHLVLLPEGDPELFEVNLGLGIRAARRGENVYLRHVTHDGRPK